MDALALLNIAEPIAALVSAFSGFEKNEFEGWHVDADGVSDFRDYLATFLSDRCCNYRIEQWEGYSEAPQYVQEIIDKLTSGRHVTSDSGYWVFDDKESLCAFIALAVREVMQVATQVYQSCSDDKELNFVCELAIKVIEYKIEGLHEIYY